MTALIDSVNDGSLLIAGEYNRGQGQYAMRSPAPLIAVGGSLAPGLFAARRGTNFSQVTSVDQVTSPTVADIVGAVARQKVSIGGDFSYYDLMANLLDNQTFLDILERAEGYFNAWAGTALTDPSKVWIATTTSGTGSSQIIAGSVVSAATPNALDISSIATFSSYAGGSFNYSAGGIVPVVINNIRR
jgi:hypothetical protein